MQQMGKFIFIIGVILLVVGGVLWLGGSKFSWIGNLPGDIKIKKENVHVYIPITTMLLISALLTFIMWIVNKFR